jgi:hypothetical protein
MTESRRTERSRHSRVTEKKVEVNGRREDGELESVHQEALDRICASKHFR